MNIKSNSNEKPEPRGNDETISAKWGGVLACILLFHLVAVSTEPFAFFSRSDVQNAPDAQVLRNVLRPYTQTLYLDHGYFFFAPNPGPSHLLRIVTSDSPLSPVPDDRYPVPISEVRASDGGDVSEHIFPDRTEQFPRLLYHRYFMLSEFYYSRYAPRTVPPHMANVPNLRRQWERDRSVYQGVQDSLIAYARNEFEADFVRLDRMERTLPDRESILREGIRLTDLRWLSVLPESIDLPFEEGR